MQEKKGLYTYDISKDFLKLLLKHQHENQQIKFILEAYGYDNPLVLQEETRDHQKTFFKTIFKKGA